MENFESKKKNEIELALKFIASNRNTIYFKPNLNQPK